MDSRTICVKRNNVFIAALTLVFGLVYLLVSNGIGTGPTSLNSRAASPTQYDCAATVTNGVSGRTYYMKTTDNGVSYTKDAAGNYRIDALGLFCTEDLATSTRCRDVRMEYGNCRKPLFQIGLADKFYANTSCQGAIISNQDVSSPMSSQDIQQGYCESAQPVLRSFSCPKPYQDLELFLLGLPTAGINYENHLPNFGNYCKLTAGIPVPGFERFGASCSFFHLGSNKNKIIFSDVKADEQGRTRFYLDRFGIYSLSNPSRYCGDDESKDLNMYLSKNPDYVECERYVSKGLPSAKLRFAGNNTFYSGDEGSSPIKIVTAADVCRGTTRISTCYNYGIATGAMADSKLMNKQFKTADEITFIMLDGTPIANVNAYCGFKKPLDFNTLL